MATPNDSPGTDQGEIQFEQAEFPAETSAVQEHVTRCNASAPLFIPGLGAVIRLRQEFTDSRQDARVALAGPTWGLGAAIVCALVFTATHEKIWAALAQFGAFINLFNLLPIWQIDGGRVFRSLNRPQFGIESLPCSSASPGLNIRDSAQGRKDTAELPLTTRRDLINIRYKVRAILAPVTRALRGCRFPAVIATNLTQCHEPASATYRTYLQGQHLGP